MRSVAPVAVTLVVPAGQLRISPFLQVTRGIAFRVRTLSGKEVAPLELPRSSPPPPPLTDEKLVAVTPGAPYHVETREPGRNIYPGPGTYKVSAVVFLFDPGKTPARRLQVESAPVRVRVTE